MPLYLGASYDHMARGATVVEGSSAPLGGASTNCVIAGHRGWNQTAMFRDIERLQLGNTVTLHTVWEDLTYTVAGIRIISPADTQAVRVREGLDLVTLVTCHPYGYNYQRYVVYCVRDDSTVSDASQADGSADIFGVDKPERDVGEGGADAVLGNPAFEDALRITGVAVLAVCFYIVLTRIRARR